MTSLRHRLGAFLALLCGASGALAQTVPAYPMPPLQSSGTGLAPGASLPPGSLPLSSESPVFSPANASSGMMALPQGGGSIGSTGTLCGSGACDTRMCCGPVGANGPVTYEVFFRTGPDFVIGGSSDFSSATRFGWSVGGGGRSLFFNPQHDAAWVLELGGGYTYNDGDAGRILDVFTPAPIDTTTGRPSRPDELHPFTVRSLHRSYFSYAIGRDWFLNGPGTTSLEAGPNRRFGVDVGGRWGYAHADLIPVENPAQYLRKSHVFHGLTIGTSYGWERPMGTWILFAGVRGEWSFSWMNILPPVNTNLSNLGAQGFAGIRF